MSTRPPEKFPTPPEKILTRPPKKFPTPPEKYHLYRKFLNPPPPKYFSTPLRKFLNPPRKFLNPPRKFLNPPPRKFLNPPPPRKFLKPPPENFSTPPPENFSTPPENFSTHGKISQSLSKQYQPQKYFKRYPPPPNIPFFLFISFSFPSLFNKKSEKNTPLPLHLEETLKCH